jgi:hypothetical protein
MHRLVPLAAGCVLVASFACVAPAMAATAPAASPRSAPTVSPSTLVVREQATVGGTLPAKAARRVILQRTKGRTWTTLAAGRTSASGRYRLPFTAPTAAGALVLRIKAPAARVKRHRYGAWTSPSRQISVVNQTIALGLPASAVSGDLVTASVTLRPVRTRRPITLQRWTGSRWVTLATATQGASPSVPIRFVATPVGRLTLRAVAAGFGGIAPLPSAPASVVVTTPPAPMTLSVVTGRSRSITAGNANDLPLDAVASSVDSDGNLYIADNVNKVVERVDVRGALTVFGGKVNQSTFTPTPGPATSTALGNLSALTTDPDGNVFVASWDNIYKITPSGTLSHVAGGGTQSGATAGPALSHSFNQIKQLVTDQDGDLYVADTAGHVVERITPGGTLSIVAGTGADAAAVPGPALSSPLRLPSGVGVGPAGEVYIVTEGDHRIWKVSDGTLAPVTLPTPTTDPDEDLDLANPLRLPTTLAVDSSGVLYWDNAVKCSIWRLDGTDLRRIAGQYGDCTLPQSGLAADSELGARLSLSIGPDHSLDVADEDSTVVERISTTGALSIVAGVPDHGDAVPGSATSSPLQGARDLAFDADQNLLVADTFSGFTPLLSVTPGGALSLVPLPASPKVELPYAVAAFGGAIYLGDDIDDQVLKRLPDGHLTVYAGSGGAGSPVAGPALSSPLGAAESLAFDSRGNLYIADRSKNVVEKVTPTGDLTIAAGTGASGSPTPGLATRSAVASPSDLAVDAIGNLYIVARGSCSVLKVTPTGSLSVVAGLPPRCAAPTVGPATASALQSPAGVAVAPDGTLYVADGVRLLRVAPSGAFRIVAGTGGTGWPTPGPALSSSFRRLGAVTMAADGDVYVIDQDSEDVLRLSSGP